MEQLPQTFSDQLNADTLIMTMRGLERPDQIRARDLCAAHIERYYPTYMQLNILRAGSADDQARMSRFIDACRAWSNGDAPAPADLDKIQP